jgi:hypothetical protein
LQGSFTTKLAEETRKREIEEKELQYMEKSNGTVEKDFEARWPCSGIESGNNAHSLLHVGVELAVQRGNERIWKISKEGDRVSRATEASEAKGKKTPKVSRKGCTCDSIIQGGLYWRSNPQERFDHSDHESWIHNHDDELQRAKSERELLQKNLKQAETDVAAIREGMKGIV